MNDDKLVVVFALTSDEFTTKINALLSEGCWRITETEMSVSDSHYVAMLIKEQKPDYINKSSENLECFEYSKYTIPGTYYEMSHDNILWRPVPLNLFTKDNIDYSQCHFRQIDLCADGTLNCTIIKWGTGYFMGRPSFC